MKTGRSRTLMTVLLAAVILPGGIMPPSFQHAHAEGETPHHHDPQLSTSARAHGHRHHHHQHSPPDDHSHQAFLGASVVKAAASHVHGCLLWLYTITPVDQNGDAPDASDTTEPGAMCLARGTGSGTVLYGRTLPQHVVIWVPVGGAVVRDLAAPSHSQGGRQILASIPLCDTARGERSGVQLI